MTQKSDPSTAALWARFRFSVVGSLLSSPPAQGELKAALALVGRQDLDASGAAEARSVSRPPPSSAGTTRRGARRTTLWASCDAPCARTAARCR